MLSEAQRRRRFILPAVVDRLRRRPGRSAQQLFPAGRRRAMSQTHPKALPQTLPVPAEAPAPEPAPATVAREDLVLAAGKVPAAPPTEPAGEEGTLAGSASVAPHRASDGDRTERLEPAGQDDDTLGPAEAG